jgi:hypothetical protein
MTEPEPIPFSGFSRPDPFAAELALGPPIRSVSPGTGYAETLEEMGTRLLERVAEAAVGKGIQLPPRQVYYMSPIPADCEQVAALFSNWTPTPGQDGPTICQPWRWMANWSVIITRCTPAMPGKGRGLHTVPAEKMMAAGKLASDDTEVLLAVVNSLDEIGADTTVVANAPSGGYQTVELNVPLIMGSSL